jgi:ABC-type uncharacterized transport system ATPase subunit
MIVVRCKECNTEITSHPSKTQCCGCPNMMTVCGDKISALDLGKVVMTNSFTKKENTKTVLSTEDLSFQEARRQRKVRKLDFEVR